MDWRTFVAIFAMAAHFDPANVAALASAVRGVFFLVGSTAIGIIAVLMAAWDVPVLIRFVRSGCDEWCDR